MRILLLLKMVNLFDMFLSVWLSWLLFFCVRVIRVFLFVILCVILINFIIVLFVFKRGIFVEIKVCLLICLRILIMGLIEFMIFCFFLYSFDVWLVGIRVKLLRLFIVLVDGKWLRVVVLVLMVINLLCWFFI